MPRIRKRDLNGKSREQLTQILNAAVADGTYSDKDVQKVIKKIDKRMKRGDKLKDDEMIDTLFDDLNLS